MATTSLCPPWRSVIASFAPSCSWRWSLGRLAFARPGAARRQDEPRPGLSVSQALSNAPAVLGPYIAVPRAFDNPERSEENDAEVTAP